MKKLFRWKKVFVLLNVILLLGQNPYSNFLPSKVIFCHEPKHTRPSLVFLHWMGNLRKNSNGDGGHRLWHMKNKGVQQLHASSLNSKAIDMWKVTRHPQSRHVVACNDNLFWNITVFFLLEWDVRTIIKSKLKQVSKEF